MKAQEVNFDGLIGPSHNYAGLSPGNIASTAHQGQTAFPKRAALQGLEKMWFLQQLGVPQAVLPPAQRPDLPTLQKLGFGSKLATAIQQAYKQAPHLLAACYSASTMWSANAATVTASQDSQDNRVHITPANLISTFHRSLEAKHTAQVLQRIFHNSQFFVHHAALPAHAQFADEGAANHTRLCAAPNQSGINLLVYGRQDKGVMPKRFPARQTAASYEALIRNHKLKDQNYLLIQQNPESIDQGVFHNDVICVGHQNVLLLHQQAFLNQSQSVQALKDLWHRLYPDNPSSLQIIEISSDQLSPAQAVDSYIFNSQIISPPGNGMILIAPTNSQHCDASRRCIEQLLKADNPIRQVEYFDLTESMNNGGGPACLRLRVPLTNQEYSSIHQEVILDFTLYTRLKAWINKHYREQITPSDLADPTLPLEINSALDELTEILKLPRLYPFQQ